ncbi:uncharacterized protein [Magallana gigas]|uniref:uncharacterized protein isoform X2 n=1 Tax=Magallana gigas TaxID=29159 RepID=UPI0033419B0F
MAEIRRIDLLRGRFVLLAIFFCHCKLIDGYKFPVYTTQSCPRNQTEWNKRSSAINCTESNGYLCLPSEDLIELLEFCYFDYQIPIAKGLCMFLRKRDSFIDDYSCRNFVEGCPNSTYRIYEAYKYRSCVSIGNGCFLDDPTCVRTTATYKVTFSSRTTAAVESQEKTKHERNDWVWIITLLGVFVLVFIPFVMYRIKIKAVQVLEESDLEETESMSKKSILMTKNKIEEMKTNTFQSLKKNLYILSDINGHFNEEGFFNKDFVQAAFDLERHSFALDHESLEIYHQFEIELGDMFVQYSGVKTACDVVVFCLNKGYYDEKNELIDGVSNPLNSCMITLQNFTDVNARHCHLLVEHGEFLPQILKALQRLTSSHLEDNKRVCYRTCKFLYLFNSD